MSSAVSAASCSLASCAPPLHPPLRLQDPASPLTPGGSHPTLPSAPEGRLLSGFLPSPTLPSLQTERPSCSLASALTPPSHQPEGPCPAVTAVTLEWVHSLSHRPTSLNHRPTSLNHRPTSLKHRPISLNHRPTLRKTLWIVACCINDGCACTNALSQPTAPHLSI